MIIWFFLLQFVNVVYHIGSFVYIEKPLHPWNKSHLIMVCELLLCCRAWFASVLLSFVFFFFASGLLALNSFFNIYLFGCATS